MTITRLHVHPGAKGPTGRPNVASFTDADGVVTVTAGVTGTPPATLQAILDDPRGHYANLHTSVNTGGGLRAQLHNPKKD